MKLKVHKINKVSLLSLVTLFIFIISINITYLNDLFKINTRYIFFLRLLCIGIYFALIVLKRKKTSWGLRLLNILYLVILISTFINNESIEYALQRISWSLLPCLVYAYYSDNEIKKLKIIKIWNFCFSLLCTLDFLTLIIIPQGLYSTNLYSGIGFLGYKTERTIYNLCWIIFSAFISVKENQKIGRQSYIAIIISLFASIFSNATGAVLCLLLALGLFILLDLSYLCKNYTFLYKIFNYKTIVISYVVVFIVVVLTQNITIISDVAEKLFGKTSTLSGRTNIWIRCLAQFLQSPIIGKGFLSIEKYVKITLAQTGTNAHNLVISLLITGGILALAVFLIFSVKVLYRKKSRMNFTELVLVTGIIDTLFIGISSSALAFCPFAYFFFIMIEYEHHYPFKSIEDSKT